MTGLVARFALGPVVSSIGGALGKAWDWITDSAVHLLLAALAVVGLYGFWQHLEAVKWHKVAESTFAAQKTATAAQVAVNHEPARKSAEIAEKSNVDAQAYYEQGRRAGASYADAHRVHASCTPGAPDLPRTDSPAPEHDGPGEAPDMVAVSRADFDTLTGNSLRLAKVQQDAQSLIDDGVAVPLPHAEFAQP